MKSVRPMKAPRVTATRTNIVKPVKLTVRAGTETRPGEAYLQHASGTLKYIVGLAARRDPEYSNIIKELRKEIEGDKITTVEAAKAWIAERVAE